MTSTHTSHIERHSEPRHTPSAALESIGIPATTLTRTSRPRHDRTREIPRLFIRTLAICAAGLLAACGGIQTKAPTTASAAVTPEGKIEVNADWDDLWAAAMGGASAYGWIVVSEQERTPTSIKFEMLSVRDRTGWLLAERADPAREIEYEPVLVTLTAHLGRFGDHEMENALLVATAHRLEALVGESFSMLPIREFVPEQPVELPPAPPE